MGLSIMARAADGRLATDGAPVWMIESMAGDELPSVRVLSARRALGKFVDHRGQDALLEDGDLGFVNEAGGVNTQPQLTMTIPRSDEDRSAGQDRLLRAVGECVLGQAIHKAEVIGSRAPDSPARRAP